MEYAHPMLDEQGLAEKHAQAKKQMEEAMRPRCAVGGMVRRGAMCGSVIVGGKFCGHPGDCQHKMPPNALANAPASTGD